MNYRGRVRVNYDDRPTRVQRFRVAETAYLEMTRRLAELEGLWRTTDHSMAARRDSCTSVAVAISLFAKECGVSEFAIDRINDLTVGLGELLAGRTSALLQRADVPTRTPSATDLVNQAIAQVCVDVFREAGLSAGEAWTRTARLFLAKGFKNFSVSKIKSLGSRLKGPGASMDAAFGEYQMITDLADTILARKGIGRPYSEPLAEAVARQLISKAREMDHRLAA